VVHWSLTGISLGFRLAGAAVVTICLLGSGASAQGKLDARYVATLAGVPIGKGAWVIDIGDDQFTAAASGMTSGLLRVFATGQGNAASRGAVRSDILAPTIFVSTINNEKRVEELRIVLSAGIVKELVVDPPTTPNPERVPLTDAHRRGVTDPMSAALIRVSGSGDPVSPEACRRTLPVFDGRMRFDLQLSFKRIEPPEKCRSRWTMCVGMWWWGICRTRVFRRCCWRLGWRNKKMCAASVFRFRL